MALTDVVNINIGLQTTGITQAGFGVPIFIGNHRYFTERVRSYNSLASAQEDLPAGSPELAAVQGFFSATPSPSTIMIGRVEADAEISIPDVEEAETYSMRIRVNGDETVDLFATAAPGDTAEEVIDAFLLQIDGSATVDTHITATKVGTGTAATLVIEAATADDVFALEALSQVEVEYTATETAAEALAAIREQNDDFYYITASDHTETFVLEMAAAVETLSKVYITSVGTVNSLSVQDPPIDIGGKLADADYFRTHVMFHHLADTLFPETHLISKFSTLQPGMTDWEMKQLAGVGVARHPTTLQALTYNQKNNLDSKNMSFIEEIKGVNVVRGGKVAAGEWLDVITSRDLLEARLSEALVQKRLWSDKIPMTNPGIVALRSVVETTANRYVETDTQPNILEQEVPYELNFPRRETMSAADVAAGIYTATGKFYLSGAIRVFTLNASLTYRV